MDCFVWIWGQSQDLLVFNARHMEGYISLGFVGESLHFCKELRPGCYLNATVYLDVNELGALECVIFVPDSVTLTEPTGSEFPGEFGSGGPAQYLGFG